METRPPVVWRALSVVLFVGMFGFSLVKAQGCQREAKPAEADEVLPATKSGIPFDEIPTFDEKNEGAAKPTGGTSGGAEAKPDAGGKDAGSAPDAAAKIEVMPATKFGPVFPATKSGAPVRIPAPNPAPQQQNAPKK